MATIKIKVYACRYCELISADPKKFIPTAVDSGDLPSMEDFLTQQFSITNLYDYFEELARDGRSCAEALAQLEDDYEAYLCDSVVELFNDRHNEDFWCDEIELEVGGVGFGSIVIKAADWPLFTFAGASARISTNCTNTEKISANLCEYCTIKFFLKHLTI